MVRSSEAPLNCPQQAVSLISKVLWMNAGVTVESQQGHVWRCLCGFRRRPECEARYIRRRGMSCCGAVMKEKHRGIAAEHVYSLGSINAI